MRILIVGYGVVGHNLHKDLAKLQPDVYDKYKTAYNTKDYGIKYDIAFICTDTPYNDKGVCDLSAVEAAIQETNADIYVIKSTVLPKTTEKFVERFGKKIIFSPEYYGGTQHCNNFDYNFTILGGNKDWSKKVIQALQDIHDARHKFYMTDSTTAELVKYMENSYLATKVAFCCQFFDIAEKLGVNYEELRELFVLDPRINPSHTFVYREHPYYSTHCLNKDVPAIAYSQDAELLKAVIEFNEKRKS